MIARLSVADRSVVVAVAYMYVAIPLYGTFNAFDPVTLPLPPLVSYGGAVAIALSMFAAAAVCVWGAVRRPIPRRQQLGLLLAGAAIVPAAVLGMDPLTGLELAAIVLAMGIAGVALLGYASERGVLRLVAGAWLGAALVCSLVALGMLLTRTPPALYAYHNGRAVGIFLNPNEFAAYLLVVLGVAGGVTLAARGALRVTGGVTLAVCLVALAATYSRWGLFAAVCGAGAFALWAGGRRAWTLLAVAAVAALLILAGPLETHHNPRDDTSRIVAWKAGVRTWLAFPLTGVGPLAFRRTYEDFRAPEAPGGEAPVAFDPHSLPLAFLDESGLVGFVTLLWCWSVFVRAIPQALAGADRRRQLLVYAAAGGLVALNVHVLVNTISIYFALALQGAALTLALAQKGLDGNAA